MPRARPEGSGRKPREQGMGAASATAGPLLSRSEAEVRLLETILGPENMMAALRRVVANKGAPGADGMPVEDLRAYLVAPWPRIKEDLLAGRYRPAPVRGGRSPSPAAASACWGSRRCWTG
jgi:RNA-directed DNA polymerase